MKTKEKRCLSDEKDVGKQEEGAERYFF